MSWSCDDIPEYRYAKLYSLLPQFYNHSEPSKGYFCHEFMYGRKDRESGICHVSLQFQGLQPVPANHQRSPGQVRISSSTGVDRDLSGP